MLCSNPSSRSSTSWLDRLRISKGFSPLPPSDQDLDLGHFLSSSTTITTTTTTTTTTPLSPTPPPPFSAAVRCRPNNLAAVLSDLFVMGPAPPSLLTKVSRKQSRPRSCSAASAASAAAAADHSSTEVKKKAAKPPRRKRCSRGAPAADLSTFSKTEVTVIDTSVVGWKTEKVIFRRGTMWKVRDRKVWTAWRKKRKLGLAGKGKEKNLADVGDGRSAKEDLNALNEDEVLKENKYASISKEAKGQVPLRRRHNLLRLARIPASKDLSVYELQSMSTDTKRELPPKAKFKGK